MNSFKIRGRGNINLGKPNAPYKIFRHKKSGEYSYSTSLLGSDYVLLKKEYPNGDSAYARVIDLNIKRKSK